MSDQNIINNQKGHISSWLGIIILLIIAIIVWTAIFIYSRSQPEEQIPIQQEAAQQQKQENQIYSYSGTVIGRAADKITIQVENKNSKKKITGQVDNQTNFIRLGIPKTNPEGQRSGKLFQRNESKLTDIKIGDQVTLKSYPDKPINNLTSFLVKTVELRYTY